MRRIRLIVQYEGTNYVGWQVQPNGIAVQQMLELALKQLVDEDIRVHGSGRTDSGVHAYAQVAHFDTNAKMPAGKFAIAMNTRLPRDIRVLYSEECSNDFHARFSAKRKQYRYCISLSTHAEVFSRLTCLHIHKGLDVELMNRAAELCLGEHDFGGFMSAGTNIENTTRCIYLSKWTLDGSRLYYDVEGNGFLYNMVRILVGTMLAIGAHERPLEDMQRALSSADRSAAGATAPAHGLMLMRVVYPDFDTKKVLEREF